MKSKIINIEGMTCSACSTGLEKYLNKQLGVEATVNLVMATASVKYDEKLVTEEDIDRFIKEAGFKSLGEKRKDGNSKNELTIIKIFSVISVLVMYISMGKMIKLPIPSILDKTQNPKVFIVLLIVLAALSIIWGFDIIKNGIKNILYKMPNMDSLVGIGVIINFLYSLFNSYYIFQGKNYLDRIFFESTIMIILFVKIGRYIDKKNKAKAIDSIKNLVTITPKKATILVGDKEITVTINEIRKNDIVICKPGEKIAVDGEIIKGETHTDESFITGESNPVNKSVGDKVLAGSINYDGVIEYKAENIGKDSSISHIVDLIVEATNTKAPIARLADSISGKFVPVIFIISIVSFIINLVITKNLTQAITSLVSVLVVACPCALGLATPLAMVVSLGKASENGLVIKSSESLESINKIDTIIFDKTGTLTKGKLEIVDQKYGEKENRREDYKILQSLESKSNHPLAKSICKNADRLYKVEEFKEISGYGVSGTINGTKYFAGNSKLIHKMKLSNPFKKDEENFSSRGESIVYLFNENKVLAIYGLKDDLKEDIYDTIVELKKLNKKLIILSGDNQDAVLSVASKLGIDEFYSNVTPKGKLELIKELNKNDNVLMLGDGINDSPALKTATIGISVANGTDISSDASDIIMLSEDMTRLVDLIKLGRKTIRIIKQNLFWALFYNLCMVPLATGLFVLKLNPMVASLAMVFSSLTVVLNSLRLKR